MEFFKKTKDILQKLKKERENSIDPSKLLSTEYTKGYQTYLPLKAAPQNLLKSHCLHIRFLLL